MLAGAISGSSGAYAQVVDVELRTTVFYEPSDTSQLLVLHPAVAVSARATESLSVAAGYEADIVSGASEAVKAGRSSPVDVVSAATSFEDTRHVVNGSVAVTRESTEVSAGYAYGTENDYRSHSLTVRAATNFLQRNTELSLSYARSFDEVCTSAYREADDPSSRPRLDSSAGCFTSRQDRAIREVSVDDFQAAWTQSWTPVLATQAVLSGSIQHGFLANPYRAVVIAPAGDEALENHPTNRARGSLSLRAKLYVRALETAFGASARLYRDTWDVFSHTYELDAERALTAWMRVQVRGRYSSQTAALFYSDDYTGGEPIDGPRGQYWTGDRELSPLSSYALGGRVLLTQQRPDGGRTLGIFTGVRGSVSVELIRTDLRRFTWGGTDPDDTQSLFGSLGVAASF